MNNKKNLKMKNPYGTVQCSSLCFSGHGAGIKLDRMAGEIIRAKFPTMEKADVIGWRQ